MRSYTFYAKESGLQIYCTTVVKPRGYQYGRIALRVFPLEGGRDKRIILMLLPEEAYKLNAIIRSCLNKRQGSSNVIIHQRQKEDVEIITILHVDRWEKDGKSGWGITLVQKKMSDGKKNKSKISVALSAFNMGFLARLLDAFSVEQAFEEQAPQQPEDDLEPEQVIDPEQGPEDDEIPF